MPGYRLYLSRLLPLVLLAGCDTPIEPVIPTETGNSAGIKLNAPSNPSAAAASHDVITLSWQDNSTNETGFEVHRSTTGANGAFELRTSLEANATSAGDGGLTATTQYCYRIRAFRKTGNKFTYSTFTTAVCATTGVVPRPAAPSGVKATPQFSGFQTTISWSDNSTNETGFRVERSNAAMETWALVGTAGQNATSLQYQQYLGVEQPVCFRVFAINTFGDSDPSNTDCPVVPAAPSSLTATVSGNNVNLAWTDNSGVEDGYVVERYSEGIALSVVATLPANTTTYQDAGLADNTYVYYVRASKDGSTSDRANHLEVLVATTPPAAPVSLNATPASSSIVSVHWLDGSVNEEGVRIERAPDPDPNSNWVLVATIERAFASYGFADYDRTSEQQVCYRAVAFNSTGDSPRSNVDCTTPPAAPTGVTAADAGTYAVDFAWTDNSGVEEGYHILVDYSDYYYPYTEVIASVEPNVTSYYFENFFYWGYPIYVAAFKDGGYSDFSFTVFSGSEAGARSVRPPLSGRLLDSQRTRRAPRSPVLNRRP